MGDAGELYTAVVLHPLGNRTLLLLLWSVLCCAVHVSLTAAGCWLVVQLRNSCFPQLVAHYHCYCGEVCFMVCYVVVRLPLWQACITLASTVLVWASQLGLVSSKNNNNNHNNDSNNKKIGAFRHRRCTLHADSSVPAGVG
jgi:hypothetical protein